MADQEGDMTPDPTSTITASGHGILGFWQNKIIPKKSPLFYSQTLSTLFFQR